MSSAVALDIQNYIERIALLYENNAVFFPTTEAHLLTKILRNKPPIEQSSTDAVIPYITVFESQTPIREVEVAGRDSRDAQGGRVMELEIYSVAIVHEISAVESQKKLHTITQNMRDILGKNLRLTNPTTGLDPLCRTNTIYEIPYLLSLNQPSLRAINVVCRPQVYVSLR